MKISNKNIDGGKAFDWGRISSDYAKFRDIYPQKFYQKIIDRDLCINGQSPDNSFDVITACQCFWYFDHKTVMPKLYCMLKKEGSILVLYMAWLPSEDEIADESELLKQIAPDEFNILHYGAIAEIRKN